MSNKAACKEPSTRTAMKKCESLGPKEQADSPEARVFSHHPALTHLSRRIFFLALASLYRRSPSWTEKHGQTVVQAGQPICLPPRLLSAPQRPKELLQPSGGVWVSVGQQASNRPESLRSTTFPHWTCFLLCKRDPPGALPMLIRIHIY